MFGLLTIDEGPPLSMTAGPATSAGLVVSVSSLLYFFFDKFLFWVIVVREDGRRIFFDQFQYWVIVVRVSSDRR